MPVQYPAVTLDLSDIIRAGRIGVAQYVDAIRSNVVYGADHHSDPLDAYVSAAIAELAVAKFFGFMWEPSVGILSAGYRLGIRSTALKHGRLPMHRHSRNDRPYLLVLTHNAPTYMLAGWLWGVEGKHPQFWEAHLPRPCFMVDQRHLRPALDLVGL